MDSECDITIEDLDDDTYEENIKTVNNDCCWNFYMSSRNQKIIWVLLYTLLLFNVINLFLAGASRFSHSQGSGVALFVFQLIIVVPMHIVLVYVIVINKWMITP